MGKIKVALPSMDARYKATAVYKPLYEMLHDWLLEYGYTDDFGTDKYMETLYSIEENPGGDLINIWWRLVKKDTGNSRITYHLNFEYLGIAVNDTEVKLQDKTIKAQKGELNFFINAWVELDYGNEWDNSPILKFFTEFFKKRVWKKEMEMHKKLLYQEVYKFQGVMKQYFDMYQFMPEKNLFWVQKGYE